MSSATRADDLARRDGAMRSIPDAATSTSSLPPLSSASASAPGWGAAGPVAVLIDELIGALRPTPASDRRRRAVFQHVADLINGCFENENVLVTAFGSVPLRTYLPDGDIDVCLLGPHELLAANPCWTSRLRDHIEFAEADAAAHDAVSPFAVSEIHVVHAEVRLMKCICDGVVVDISANQFGGLATLGFLEEVDAFVSARLKSEGLFKRSIVLIKAWGFYEGRLLGAHHALISTYALETLVLYVLNKFHAKASLTTPLEVLHTFLRVFADFDWDAHAVSIHGPVRLADLAAGTTGGEGPGAGASGAATASRDDASRDALEDETSDELLTPEFMWRMLDKYGNESIMRRHAARGANGARSAGGDASAETGDEISPFSASRDELPDPPPRVRVPIKHMNVIDPLLPSNNLGRSVSQGNAARIRKALKLAAAKLGELREMSFTNDSCDFLAARVLREFFGNTAKHRRVALLPSAPATPGGREHADEVSMTPSTQRRHSVTVSREGRVGDAVGGPARRLLSSLSDPALTGLRVRVKEDDSSFATRVANDDDNSEGSDRVSEASLSVGSPGSDSDRGWPRLGPASPEGERAEPRLIGRGCPVMHARASARVEDEDRGPFWGRWEPLPAAELAAAAAAEALANRHFPRLSDASAERETNDRGEASGESVGADSREASAAVVAAAFVAAADESARAATPRRARGLSLGGEGDFDELSPFHRQLAGGSTPGGSSRAESRGASTRGGGHFAEMCAEPRSGDGPGGGHDPLDAAALPPLGTSLLGTSPTKGSPPNLAPEAERRLIARTTAGPSGPFPPRPPPVPPGPPPPGVARAARDAAAARVRREANVATFFPETFGDREVAIGTRARGIETGMFSPERVSMPPPAVTPPGTVGLGFESAPPRDIFAGDLEAIWRHLEFGRHYHRVAIRRRYEYERAAQHAAQRAAAAAAAAAAAVRRGAFGRNRRRKGDAATTRGLAAGDGFAAAAAAAIAAGAEPPRGRDRDGRNGGGGGGRSERRRKTSGQRRGSGDEGERESARETPPGAPPAPPGPPPGGVDVGPGGVPVAPSVAPPSWGPKGAAALDVIRRAPSSADVAEADSNPAPVAGASAEVSAATPALASATGAKGSWSSLVAAGQLSVGKQSVAKESSAATRLGARTETARSAGEPHAYSDVGGPIEEPIEARSSVTERTSEPADLAAGGAAKAPPRPPPLAGAWAKGPVTDALRRRSVAVSDSEKTLTQTDGASAPPVTTAGSPPGSPSSPTSETSGDSNAEQKENPNAPRRRNADASQAPEEKKKEASSRGPGRNPGASGAEAPDTGDSAFVRKEDDFPGLGGKPAVSAATAATAGVWGGRKAE